MGKNVISYIDEVNTERDSWALKVRILRIWKQTYQMDMILMDEKVQKIHATIRKVLIHVFENILQEGDTIVLSRFGVAANDGKYPVIKHEYKLNFYRNTAIQKCQDFKGPLYGFRFVPFDEIINDSVAEDMTVDVIANVVHCTDLEIFDRNGRETKRISLDLEDLEGKRVGCTLWDTFAQQFSTFLANDSKDVNLIIIIQFAKIRHWKGKPTVQNSMFGTRVFINDDINEVNEFKNNLLLKNRDDSSSQFPTPLSSQTVYADRHDFLLNHQKKFLDELVEIKEEMVCCVFGTIKSIQEQYGWFYAACRKCNKKVVPKWEIVDFDDISSDVDPDDKNGVLYCPKCKTQTTSIIPRYKVNVRLQDDTGTMSFVLFDNEVFNYPSNKTFEIHSCYGKKSSEFIYKKKASSCED